MLWFILFDWKEVFETVANYSQNNFRELKIYNNSNSGISSEDLESSFISLKNRTPKRILSLIIIKVTIEIIEKYENIGIIKLRTIEGRDEEKY